MPLEVGGIAWDEQQIDGALADDLVCDVDALWGLRVMDIRCPHYPPPDRAASDRERP